MNEHTLRLRNELDEIVRRGKELVMSVDEATLTRRPAAGSWSAAECVDHLSVVAETYVRRIRRALDAAPKQPPRGSEKLTFLGKLMVRFAEPPARMRLPVPPKLVPAANAVPREELVARYASTHAELIRLLEESDAVDRRKIRVATPASRRVTLPVLDVVALIAAHARRHLWQAERAMR
ncbi:MAG TPA: DinB family protein [Thermoanaerobaculia bacterium]|nr:DinB family protein [Thermoanaerobaculia bacterium]